MLKKFKPSSGRSFLSGYKNRHWDLENARRIYKNKPSNNLIFLLCRRFNWMQKYIKNNDLVVEIGCGIGASKDFLKAKKIIITDLADSNWIDMKVDALNMPFKDNSVDVVVCSNLVHHIYSPIKLMKEISRVLKPNGYFLIQEINASLAMRAILVMTNHEGYNFNSDVFNENEICNDPNDVWSANCAIPNMLFDDQEKFHKNIKFFKIISQSHSEFFIFPLSGGVTAKMPMISLSNKTLNLFNKIDKFLIRLSSNTFALQRQIALRKI